MGRAVATEKMRRGDTVFGFEPGDPGTLAGAAVLLAIVAAVAAAVPARRASRLDPASVLREG